MGNEWMILSRLAPHDDADNFVAAAYLLESVEFLITQVEDAEYGLQRTISAWNH